MKLLNNAETAVTIKEQFDKDIEREYPKRIEGYVNLINSMRVYNKEYYYSWEIPYSIDSVHVNMIPQFFKLYPKRGIALAYIYDI